MSAAWAPVSVAEGSQTTRTRPEMGKKLCLTMLDVIWIIFEEPDVIFLSDTRVDNREREAWGCPTSTANSCDLFVSTR